MTTRLLLVAVLGSVLLAPASARAAIETCEEVLVDAENVLGMHRGEIETPLRHH